METYPSLVSILNMTFDNSSVNYSRFYKLYGTVCFHSVLAKPENLRLRRADKPLRRADKPLRRANRSLRRSIGCRWSSSQSFQSSQNTSKKENGYQQSSRSAVSQNINYKRCHMIINVPLEISVDCLQGS